MKLHQLSVFLENKPGSLTLPCRLLAEAGVNLVTLSLADTQQFGILRLVVREWERARQILETGGCVVKVTEVVAIEVPDRPGGLLQILQVLEGAGVNVEYMYAFAAKQGGQAVLVFRFSDPEVAIRTLQQAGVNVIDPVAEFTRLEA
jgi:hypothetical protein